MPIQQNVLPGHLLSVNGTIKRFWIKQIEWKNWQGLYGMVIQSWAVSSDAMRRYCSYVISSTGNGISLVLAMTWFP